MASDFDDWYRSSYAAVLAACRAMSGDDQQACEATDEAFARAYARLEQSGGPRQPGRLDMLRRVQHAAAQLAPAASPRSMDGRPATRAGRRAGRLRPGHLGGGAGPATRERTAVVLRYVADLPEAESARSMGIARGTVAATLAAARAHLSETLHHPDKEVPYG